MYLDTRSKSILIAVLRQPEVSNKDLQKNFKLTRRQIDYSLKKVNTWLKDNHHPELLRSSQGHFIINPKLYQVFDVNQPEEKLSWYIPFERQRAYLIIIMLGTRKEDFSLNLFTDELEISKNTVLADLKIAQAILASFGVNIKYSRIAGYLLKGEEWQIRSAIIYAIQEVINEYEGEKEIQYFMKLTSSQIAELMARIHLVEAKLAAMFIDKQIKVLPYFLEITFRRSKNGHPLTQKMLIDYNDISDTQEFAATNLLITDDVIISKNDKLYIALHLLTSNVLLDEGTPIAEEQKFRQPILEFLGIFETITGIRFSEKEVLLEKLSHHFKPAFYRIKYNLTIDYRILKKIDQDFDYIHRFVRESLGPLEKLIGKKIPDTESIFFALLISAHIINVNDLGINKLRAVVVCPNGLSISKLMEKELRKILPELSFYKSMSIREFEKTRLPYDVVFAPVLLTTEKTFFLVDNVISEESGKRLRQRVINTLFSTLNNQLSMGDLIETIEKHAVIQDKAILVKALTEQLAQPVSEGHYSKEPFENETKPSLARLLPLRHIQKVEKVETWIEALDLVGGRLLESEIIEPQYITTLKKQYPTPQDHIILRNTIAIPHAESSYGARETGMSLLYVVDGIRGENQRKFHLVVMIASVDKEAHFQALLELVELASQTDLLSTFRKLNTSEIKQSIEGFVATLTAKKMDKTRDDNEDKRFNK